ncbi:MAG: TIGR03986 family CRISPR-associated RAMP protein [Proteobacteria bacterium]|nr:MAG: TIGR03986 family CRISPR-associated RAMP protein [Pseudomonadota bacterium]
MMNDKFYNPYQFIPVDTKKAKALTHYPTKEDVERACGLDRPDNHFVRHDYWHKDGFSGKIRCTLRLDSPLVIGAMQMQGDKQTGESGRVPPYQIPLHNEGKYVGTQYAIPGSSLRGMVSSVAETISQSSLRVLESKGEGDYSVRKPVGDPLKKLGMLLKEDDKYFIYPLMDTANPAGYKRIPRKNTLVTSNQCYQHSRPAEPVYHEGERGILYIRGKVTKESNKSKEFWIPWRDKILDKSEQRLVPDKVLEGFNRVLKARFAEQKKEKADTALLWPKGYAEDGRIPAKDPIPEDHFLVLSGDLLYYKEEEGKISELSYSAIWRKIISDDVNTAFENAAGKNALPWHTGRDQLTPAEAIFGVVEDEPDTLSGARNLASRVRFSDATSTKPIELEPEITLKILNSPKPPSPAMYFSAEGGKYIAKENLNLKKHKPNGRKVYIPHVQKGQHWKHNEAVADDRNHMRLRCQPISVGACFEFDVYFENLSKAELGLLRTALQPAGEDAEFLHRLGLGKPYGLGHVVIDRAEVSLIDRQSRYTLQRFSQDSVYQPCQDEPDVSLVDEDFALPALLAVADPSSYEDLPVCYPYDRASNKNPHQSPHNEVDGFQWFMENDRKGGRKDFLHTTKKQPYVMQPLSSTSTRNKG